MQNLSKTRVITNTHIIIKDLQTIPQDPSLVDAFKLQVSERPQNIKNQYFKQYFKAWSPIDKQKALVIDNDEILTKEWYNQTLTPCSLKWRKQIISNSNVREYGKIGKYGIITRNTNLRCLPTIMPWFLNPNQDGEGYPFDYLQFDILYIGRPVFVSHLSLDKNFAYIQIPDYASGWVKIQDIAFLSQQQAKKWQEHKISIIKTEDTPLFTSKGNLIETAKLGTHLPILSYNKKYIIVAVPYPTLNHKFEFVSAKLALDCCVTDIQQFNAENLRKLIKELLFMPYGWGGYLGNRDCSAMIKDLYSTFYIWMPRNSSSQNLWFSKNSINLEQKTSQEKLEIIAKQGIPFKTLLYAKGHIVIYSGIYNNQPIIFHAIWGNKTLHNGIKGRNIIGKTVFSTTLFGKELKFIDKSRDLFLQNIDSMLILEE